MTKLQKALRRYVPDEIVKASNEESEIEGIGILTDVNPAETANAEWPNVAGVYALYDVSKRPIYIGQSKIIATRLRQHLEKFWYRKPFVNSAAYVRIEDETMHRRIEQVLIRFLKSHAAINSQLADH